MTAREALRPTPGHLNPVHIRWDKTCSTSNSGNTARHWHSMTADARDGITLWRASLRSAGGSNLTLRTRSGCRLGVDCRPSPTSWRTARTASLMCPIRTFRDGAPVYFIRLPLHRFRSPDAYKRVRCVGDGGRRLSNGFQAAKHPTAVINHVLHGFVKGCTNISVANNALHQQ
jgi:hypothetical protein